MAYFFASLHNDLELTYISRREEELCSSHALACCNTRRPEEGDLLLVCDAGSFNILIKIFPGIMMRRHFMVFPTLLLARCAVQLNGGLLGRRIIQS
ncbi:MAG: hypothetical protein ACRD4L_13105 [Pyrinomonadaceae bacterium]